MNRKSYVRWIAVFLTAVFLAFTLAACEKITADDADLLISHAIDYAEIYPPDNDSLVTRYQAIRSIAYLREALEIDRSVLTEPFSPSASTVQDLEENFFSEIETEDFSLDANASRQEIFVIVAQAFALQTENPDIFIIEKYFSDAEMVESWAAPSTADLIARKILYGYKHQLLPQDNIILKDYRRILTVIVQDKLLSSSSGWESSLFQLLREFFIGIISAAIFAFLTHLFIRWKNYRHVILIGTTGTGTTTLMKKLENAYSVINKNDLKDSAEKRYIKRAKSWKFQISSIAYNATIANTPEKGGIITLKEFLDFQSRKRTKIIILVLAHTRKRKRKRMVDNDYLDKQFTQIEQVWLPFLEECATRYHKVVVFINKTNLLPDPADGEKNFEKHIKLLKSTPAIADKLELLSGNANNPEKIGELIKRIAE